MIQVLATFGPFSQETAIFLIGSVVCFALAAFFVPDAGLFPGGQICLIGLGLGLVVFPTM